MGSVERLSPECVGGCYAASCLRVFVVKQKTAYEVRISDWSSDVCSSDLPDARRFANASGYLRDHGCQTPRGDSRGSAGTATSRSEILLAHRWEIGRASCRERVCQYV